MNEDIKRKKSKPNSKDLKRSKNDVECKREKRRRSQHNDRKSESDIKESSKIHSACQIVSHKSFTNSENRFLLTYTPVCLGELGCRHGDPNHALPLPMPSYAEESFHIEIKSNAWFEALEVCILCVTPKQYLTADVMKEVVEIMMNAHNDIEADCPVTEIIYKSQRVLSQNYIAHPPCKLKNIRQCYTKFLTSPMNLKDKTFTNRTEYGSDKGIVKYCFNRLEYELSSDSIDGPFVDKSSHIPEEMKQTVKGLHWQKEKFEIYELLDRNERIPRLMAVLESVLELLKYDLAIWNSGFSTRHIMRTDRPLLANILWSENIFQTGSVNELCKQILSIFIQIVHLGYPQDYVDIMTGYINLIVQTVYICESSSNQNYPNYSKYSETFAKEFYKLISEYPNASIIKILSSIKPSLMRYLVGLLHAQKALNTKQNDPLMLLQEFVKSSKWKKMSRSKETLEINPSYDKPNILNIFDYILEKCESVDLTDDEIENVVYPKHIPTKKKKETHNLDYYVNILYNLVKDYLDTYQVYDLKHQLLNSNNNAETKKDFGDYSHTESLTAKYESMLAMIDECSILLNSLKTKTDYPKEFNSIYNLIKNFV